MSSKQIKIVTTSWDDGDLRDLRIAEMLQSYAMRGTFYVPIEPFNGNPSLTPDHLRSLSAAGFEIGGHGVAHEIMSEISAGHADTVVRTCKAILEDTVGQSLRMFCYPRGRYTPQVVEALKNAGYEGARTIRLLATGVRCTPFALPTSIQVRPHTRVEYLRNIGRARNIGGLYDYMTNLNLAAGWMEIGKKLFHRMLDRGGIFHMWGHSWEIDEMNLWDELREMLYYVSRRDGVVYLNNADVLRYLPSPGSAN